ncbi:MAG TPA: sugar ABC transporter permease [Blastocatellia bacterium]|nr:sugar ABC transporter permease [Blastocatellia bacterium]
MTQAFDEENLSGWDGGLAPALTYTMPSTMINAQTARRAVWRPLWQLPGRLDLILSLARHDLTARYKGSLLGIVWAIITPVVMIAIFTFIFAGIFGARFGARGSSWDYALYLFCGLLPWTMFQETVQRASTTIVEHANLVKRVVFPLETLPVAQALSALGNQLFGSVALLLATALIHRELHFTVLWLPVVLIPQLVATFGAAWLVASLGVFFRDIAQGVTLILMAWMYLTPIIYPESIVPERYRPFINANPFTALIRSYRRIFLEGLAPDWPSLAYFSVVALVLFVFGYWWFAKTRRNFADVI